MVRNPHATMLQRRVMWIQFSPLLRVINAERAKAKGTVKPTKPR